MNATETICKQCIMDTSDPEIQFDDQGICNHCRAYAKVIADLQLNDDTYKSQRLHEIVADIKEKGKNQEYDCIIGLSGGVDSSYLAYIAKRMGLRLLAVHVDAGWNSELAVKNIELIVKQLDLDLYTVVVDWEEMKDVQLAFLKAGVANLDVPQDHVFMASLYRVANEKRLKTILGGSNLATESILPSAWGYNAADLRHLKGIHKRFGSKKLKRFPTINYFRLYFYYPFIKGIRTIHLLNYIDYVKKTAMDVLQNELGWRYYGGKHYESVFTKFFQAYYLPRRYGYDKRKAHLSSLIVSGQMTRGEAMRAMEAPLYPETEVKEDKLYISKKIGISVDELEKLLILPPKTYKDYPSNAKLFDMKSRIVRVIRNNSNGSNKK